MINKDFSNFLLSASLIIISSSAAHADGIAVGAKVSTLGIGPEITISLTDAINIRLGANFFNMDKTLTEGGNEFDFALKMSNYTAFADFHVFGGGFRLTGGAMNNKGNILSGVANSTNNYDINGISYTNVEVGDLKGELRMGQDISPYLGLGWGNNLGAASNFTFNFDLGVFFTGTPKASLTTTGGTLASNAAANQILQDNLAREQDKILEDIKDYKYYPMVSISVAYRF